MSSDLYVQTHTHTHTQKSRSGHRAGVRQGRCTWPHSHLLLLPGPPPNSSRQQLPPRALPTRGASQNAQAGPPLSSARVALTCPPGPSPLQLRARWEPRRKRPGPPTASDTVPLVGKSRVLPPERLVGREPPPLCLPGTCPHSSFLPRSPAAPQWPPSPRAVPTSNGKEPPPRRRAPKKGRRVVACTCTWYTCRSGRGRQRRCCCRRL